MSEPLRLAVAHERADRKIPRRMLEAQRWIRWRRGDKVPIDPFTDRPFEEGSGWQTDPARWTGYEDASKGDRLVGFLLGDGFIGIDLDDCVVSGVPAQWVRDLVRALGSYAEISPSGTGVKIFLQGTRPEGAKTVRKCDAWQWEIYGRDRYFTVTGNKLPEASDAVAICTEKVQKISDALWSDDLVTLCVMRGLEPREQGDNVHVRCPWESEHSHGNGPKDAALHVKDGKVVGFHCFHAHCAARTLRDVRRWFGINAGLEHPLTEAGDAECFAELYSERVRFDHRQGRWLVSDERSGIWVPDPVEQLTQMTVEMMRDRQHQALALKDDAKKKAIQWTLNGESRSRLQNALALARSVPPVADPGETWDADAFLLGVRNGVIDLRTGGFRKANPADRVTMRVRVAHDPTAGCPLWLRTLGGIFAPSEQFTDADSRAMLAFMQRALGYSVTGDCREECCFFAWGEGGNGKGTVMNTLGWLLGDYTDDLPYSTLERSERGSGIPNDVAKLVGKRFITCSEVNEFNLNEARLKALTGRDPMTARFLHREFFTFIPVCKIWIATNNKPKITGQDDGIWRRIHLIPFVNKFEGDHANKQLKDLLRTELPGILNWIVAGALAWQRDGLNPPDVVKAATDAYRQESNPISPFLDDRCVLDAKVRVQAGRLFKEYESWCNDAGVESWRRLSNKAFYKAMERRFQKVELRQGSRQTFYVGVALKADEEAPF